MRSVRAILVASFLAVALVSCSTTGTTPGPTPTTVAVTQSGTVPWIAVQDGAGAWAALSGSSFDVTDAGGRYGVAWACNPSPGGAGGDLVIVDQLTTADATTVATGCPTNTTVTYYGFTGTVAHIPSGGYALVAIGANQAKVTNSNPSYSLPAVQSGTMVAIAYGFDSSGQPTDMVVQSLNVTGAGTWDPDLTNGQPFTMNQLTASNAPAGSTRFMDTGLYPAGPPLDQGNASTSVAYATLPGGPPSGTLYSLQASAFDNASTNSVDTITYTSTPTATLDLPLPPYMGSGSGLSAASGTPTVTWAP